MTTLQFVPVEEFRRIRALPLSDADRTALFAQLCRLNTLYMVMRAGSGHIGTSFSSLDIMSWILLNELDPDSDRKSEGIFFSSKGHDAPGLYSVLIGLESLPFDLLHKLRRLSGLPGHPDVATPNIAVNTGSLGMGISKAKGMVLAHRIQKRRIRIYVLTGDGELQEGQIWESLLTAASRHLSEITVIVDNNKIQSDTRVSQVSDLGDIEGKFRSFGWHVERCDGHDCQALAQAFARLRGVKDQPQVLIADTIKGRGVSFMEHTALGQGDELYRYHSGSPSKNEYLQAGAELIADINRRLAAAGAPDLRTGTVEVEETASVGRPQRLIEAYGSELAEQGGRDPRIVVLDADLIKDCGLIPFRQRFPERFIECGIAEQDMVSIAGGLALKGLLPVVHSFACFLSSRPNEAIYTNATERTKIVYVGSLAGLIPGGPGHSHQAVRDISALGAIPGLILLEPCTEIEVAQALEFCLHRTKESCYLRLVSVPYEVPFDLPPGYRLEPGRGALLADGDAAAIIGYGPVLLSEAYKAAERLRRNRGLRIRVVNLPWLNRVDRNWLQEAVSGVPIVITLDNHYIHGGQGDMIAREIIEGGLGPSVHIRRLGVDRIPACGSNEEVLRVHGLDAEALCKTLEELLAAGKFR